MSPKGTIFGLVSVLCDFSEFIETIELPFQVLVEIAFCEHRWFLQYFGDVSICYVFKFDENFESKEIEFSVQVLVF